MASGLYHLSKAYTSEDIECAKSLKANGARLIFDLCDNHFLLPKEKVIRLKEMMLLCDAWVSSTAEMARVIISQLGEAKPITVIGDAVEY